MTKLAVYGAITAIDLFELAEEFRVGHAHAITHQLPQRMSHKDEALVLGSGPASLLGRRDVRLIGLPLE